MFYRVNYRVAPHHRLLTLLQLWLNTKTWAIHIKCTTVDKWNCGSKQQQNSHYMPTLTISPLSTTLTSEAQKQSIWGSGVKIVAWCIVHHRKVKRKALAANNAMWAKTSNLLATPVPAKKINLRIVRDGTTVSELHWRWRHLHAIDIVPLCKWIAKNFNKTKQNKQPANGGTTAWLRTSWIKNSQLAGVAVAASPLSSSEPCWLLIPKQQYFRGKSINLNLVAFHIIKKV